MSGSHQDCTTGKPTRKRNAAIKTAPINGLRRPIPDKSQSTLLGEAGAMEIQPFTKDRWSIGRPIIAEQIPWFKGNDVAASLEYANARDALHRHVEPEGKTTYSELIKGVVNPDTLSNHRPNMYNRAAWDGCRCRGARGASLPLALPPWAKHMDG